MRVSRAQLWRMTKALLMIFQWHKLAIPTLTGRSKVKNNLAFMLHHPFVSVIMALARGRASPPCQAVG
nr:MAG TPA: hypothetical protein [Caudoviricetes sp.]